jgi:hypothetical protein
MKKITNLLIVASLALAGAVMAQQPTPEESQSPGKKQSEKKPPAEVKPPRGPKTEAPPAKEPAAPKTEAPPVKEPPAPHAPKTEAPPVKEPAANEPPAAPKPDKKGPPTKKPAPATAPEKKDSAEQPAASATPPTKKEQSAETRKDKKVPATDAKTSPSATAAAAKATATPATATASTTPATAASATPATATATTTPAAATASTTPAAAASASVAPTVAQTSPAKPVNPAAVKKPDVQKVQQIQQQHVNFHAQPRPDRVPAVTFSANFRIQGSDRWQGPQYEVYRSYHPERHDQAWYRSKYQRVELISGGYYYFNNGYWYPAWGYNPTNEYYAYDAPIYAGKHAEPPDKVIANVQAVLQEMGYYKGEVDGLLGPLTREALTGYQADQGLTATAVIDEPTLDALGMG